MVLTKYLLISICFFFMLFANIANASNALPEIGTVGSSALTIDKEKEYGWAFRLMANQGLPIIHDPVLNQYINSLGQNIVSHAESVKLPFNFFLVEDKEINAAAFLGGSVKIHTGLFLYAKNESELASVIAHEVAHITQRHLARMIEQQSFNNPASLAALTGSILLALVNPAAGMAALTSTMAVSMQSQINYTRLHEFEADRIGIQTLHDAGYDPYGMANFFGMLAEKYKYANMPPQMLSTHPLPETRLAESRLRASQFGKVRVANSLEYQLSKTRITVRFNNITAESAINYYQNQLRNKKYKIKEAAQYGLGLAYFQKKNYVEAEKINNDLLKAKPNNAFYLDFGADIAIALKKPEKIIPLLTKQNKANPKNAVFALNLVIALQENKQYEQAEKVLELFMRSNPEHYLANLVAIDLYKLMNKPDKEHLSKGKHLALQGRFREASQEMGSALIYTNSRLDQARYTEQIEAYKRDDLRLKALQE
ncbi:MAG: M48 family metalloprotease [Psychromonas sp.]